MAVVPPPPPTELSPSARERWSGDCAKIAGLEPRFEDLWRRWERFQATEPALASQLIDDCIHGLPYPDA